MTWEELCRRGVEIQRNNYSRWRATIEALAAKRLESCREAHAGSIVADGAWGIIWRDNRGLGAYVIPTFCHDCGSELGWTITDLREHPIVKTLACDCKAFHHSVTWLSEHPSQFIERIGKEAMADE